jgi:hypothetical protein
VESLASAGAARRLALVLAAARVGVGLTALVAPNLVTRPWIGDQAGGLAAAVLGRALGGRDIALGLGLLMSARRQRPLRGWVEAGALADLVDTATTAWVFGRLPQRGRLLVLATASTAGVAGALVARRV